MLLRACHQAVGRCAGGAGAGTGAGSQQPPWHRCLNFLAGCPNCPPQVPLLLQLAARRHCPGVRAPALQSILHALAAGACCALRHGWAGHRCSLCCCSPQYDISEVASGGKPKFVSRVWIGERAQLPAAAAAGAAAAVLLLLPPLPPPLPLLLSRQRGRVLFTV